MNNNNSTNTSSIVSKVWAFCNTLRDDDVGDGDYVNHHNKVPEIESRLNVAGKMEESITQSLQQAEALRQSILKKAFEGKLI